MTHIKKFNEFISINESQTNVLRVLNNKKLMQELLDSLMELLPSDMQPGDDFSDYLDPQDGFDVVSEILSNHNIQLSEDDIYTIMGNLNDMLGEQL